MNSKLLKAKFAGVLGKKFRQKIYYRCDKKKLQKLLNPEKYVVDPKKLGMTSSKKLVIITEKNFLALLDSIKNKSLLADKVNKQLRELVEKDASILFSDGESIGIALLKDVLLKTNWNALNVLSERKKNLALYKQQK